MYAYPITQLFVGDVNIGTMKIVVIQNDLPMALRILRNKNVRGLDKK